MLLQREKILVSANSTSTFGLDIIATYFEQLNRKLEEEDVPMEDQRKESCFQQIPYLPEE